MRTFFTRVTKAALPAALVFLTTGCIGVVGHQFIKTDDNGTVIELKKYYVQQGDEYLVTADLPESLVLAQDALTITKMAKGSSISIKNTHSGEVLKVTEQNGNAIYTLWQHKNGSEPTAEQMNAYMLSLFNFTPLAAEERINALVKYQTLSAAVQQVEQAQNDDTKSAYVSAISKYTLDASAQKRVLSVVSSISSDYSQKVAVQDFVEKQTPLSDEAWLGVFAGLENMGSDFELRTLFSSIAAKLPKKEVVHSAFFNVSKTIGSDYEKYRFVSELVSQQTDLKVEDILAASHDIGSDYEAYRVISEVASSANTQNDINAILDFTQTIDSDYEMQRAFISLPYNKMNEGQTKHALEIAGSQIGSDYELAKVLVYICEKSPYKANLIKDVKLALASISSESDKLKVYEVL